MSETTTVALAMVTLDCADPRVEATFWSELLGWDILAVEDEYAMLKGPDSPPSASARCRTTCRRPGRTTGAASSSTSI